MVVNKILKEDLEDNDKASIITHKFIKDFVKYAFLIEEIIGVY